MSKLVKKSEKKKQSETITINNNNLIETHPSLHSTPLHTYTQHIKHSRLNTRGKKKKESKGKEKENGRTPTKAKE